MEEIANKTGFSEATVKHRLKINEIDRGVLDEAQEYFQLTIGDFVELEKVKDIDMRNEILRDASNSAEIKDGVQHYLEKLEEEKNIAQLTKLFEELGWKESKEYFHYYGGNWEQISEGNELEILKYDNEMAKKIRAIAKKEQGDIYYRFSWRYVEIARKITKKEKKAKKKTKAELRQEQIGCLPCFYQGTTRREDQEAERIRTACACGAPLEHPGDMQRLSDNLQIYGEVSI